MYRESEAENIVNNILESPVNGLEEGKKLPVIVLIVSDASQPKVKFKFVNISK